MSVVSDSGVRDFADSESFERAVSLCGGVCVIEPQLRRSLCRKLMKFGSTKHGDDRLMKLHERFGICSGAHVAGGSVSVPLIRS